MILARIEKALREQNWLAVAIEFVIVVLGVLLAFQISAWAERQAQHERVRQVTDRMIEDLQAERWRVAAVESYLGDVRSHAHRALAAIEGEIALQDEELVIAAFRASQLFWSGNIRTSYDELVSRGDVNLIPDRALRDAAVEYYTMPAAVLMSETTRSAYREAFRQRIDHRLHHALTDACAEEFNVGIGDYTALEDMLDFPCSIDGFDAQIAETAALLQTDEDLHDLLRWRVIDLEGELNSVAYLSVLLDRGLANTVEASQ